MTTSWLLFRIFLHSYFNLFYSENQQRKEKRRQPPKSWMGTPGRQSWF